MSTPSGRQPTPKLSEHRREVTMASDLYERTISFNYEDAERGDLMRRVWTPTPWMVDAFVGPVMGNREREMVAWCREKFGRECSVIHGHEGRWQDGSATIYGWRWFGFATESEMKDFQTRWPNPAGGDDGAR